jgi:DNA-binding TFAR19-related protein (PDSD5 family)
MADIVNLRQVRKQKSRGEKDQKAAENRAKHGRTKAEKQRDAALEDQARRRLDELKLDDET